MSKIKSIHGARTMMFAELEKVMDFSVDNNNFEESLYSNVFGKKSADGIRQSTIFLKTLYSFDLNYGPFNAFKYFWKNAESQDRPLLAFIYAINHDDLLAESIYVLHDTLIGKRAAIETFDANIETYHPNKYTANTRRSMAQNVASSWKQAGFIVGKVKNIRTQPEISFYVACFAFLMSYLKGNKGDFIWNSHGVKALCLNEARLRELAVECAKRDLMQYQSAGSVTVISFNNLLNKIGINAV